MARMNTVKWILSMPEGKQFLSALLITVIALVSAVVAMEIRYERNVDKIRQCEQEKEDAIKEVNAAFLDFVIKSNERAERTKEKLDSVNFELLKIQK